MTILIIILIILLTLSIINNFYMYNYNYKESCVEKYVYSLDLPKDLKYKTITFFYKDKTFKKCFKDVTAIVQVLYRFQRQHVKPRAETEDQEIVCISFAPIF